MYIREEFLSTRDRKIVVDMESFLAFAAQKKFNVSPGTIKLGISQNHIVTPVPLMQEDHLLVILPLIGPEL